MPLLSWINEFLFTEGELLDGPQHKKLPLAGPAWPLVLISVVYALFVLKLGPKWMKTREPFQLKKVMFVYNVAQILVNAFIFVACVYFISAREEGKWLCMLKVHPDNPMKYIEISASYIYFIVKIIDYMDTIFFVLRKSFKQITFLHVYHHIMMVGFTYVYLRYFGYGGHAGMVGIINSFVHAVMYTYYLVSSQRGGGQSIWWKKYITILQIAQFCLILVLESWPLLVRRDCPYPKHWLVFSVLQALLMLYLFANFYRKAYLQKDKKTPQHAQKVQ